ncbi:MAG TPA: hypothetical protein VHV78_05620 [Gemmatimonadaceae bacterium]|jgi:hypothetical protein|nr:hypothetical protein [Gemmatimonadaceae bacterium]
MLKSLVRAGIVATLSTVSVNIAAAQNGGLASSKCASGIAQDACQQAYDVYQFLAPQLGVALAGGNATIGQGSVLGGLGHFSVGVRANVLQGVVPDIGNNGFSQSTTGAQRNTLPTKTMVVGLPTADAAIGIFKGFRLPLTNILGVDALASAAYIPTITSNNVSITPQNNWQFGVGGRLGLLSESIVVPGVSFTWIERDLPQADLVGTSGANTLSVSDFKVKTSAWRIVASKSFIVFGLAVGAGQDKYDQSATITGTVSQSGFSGTESVDGTLPSMTRTNIFGDLSLNLPIFKIVGEVGQVSGGSAPTYNSFKDGSADRSLVYGSLGLRLSW